MYLTHTQGVAQSDYVINSFLANSIWPGLLKELTGSITGEAANFLTLPSPRNVINATTITCRPVQRENGVGLLGAVGWTSLIDVPAVLDSKEINDKIAEGEKYVFLIHYTTSSGSIFSLFNVKK